MSEKPFVSVCIPVYYSGPEVPRVLDELLTSIETQDYPYWRIQPMLSIQKCNSMVEFAELAGVMNKDVDIPGNPFKKRICSSINPMRDVDGPAKNVNSAMSIAPKDGYIKIMNQDDFLDSPTAISEMVEALEASESRWLVNSCVHTDSDGQRRERIHMPHWPGEKGMVEGVNRFGCPSVTMFEGGLVPNCDPNLILCMDCDMWIQLYQKAGAPVIRNVPDVVIRMWDEQLSNQIDYARSLETDKIYMRKKYGYT